MVRGAASELAPAGNKPEAEQQEKPSRAGFGEDTVSVPGATLRTIKRNLHEARRVVPSVEELRRETAARIREERERIGAETQIGAGGPEAAGPQRAPAPQTERERIPARVVRPSEGNGTPAPQRLRPGPAPQVRSFQEQEEAVRRVNNARPAPTPPPQPNPVPEGPATPARLDVLV